MQRYFVNSKENDTFTLSSDDSYHIKKVMRMKISDSIEVVFDSHVYLCEIIKLDPTVYCKIIKEIINNSELSKKVTIVQSLVKEQKMDYILQKLTELGVDSIIPYDAERSVVKLNNKKDKKIERWQTILKEAAEQSKRTKIPSILEPVNLSNLVKLIDFDMKFLCTVNENSQNLKKVLSNVSSSAKMLFVIGPEGGFTKQEEQVLTNNGFISLSLGNSVLRTETASIFIMSIIRFLDME